MGQLILGRCRYQLPNGVSQSRHFLRSPITTGLLHSVQITRMRTSTGKIPAFLRRFCKRLTHWKLTIRVSSDWGRRGSDHFLRHSDHSWGEVRTLFLWFFSDMYIFFYLFIYEHFYIYIRTYTDISDSIYINIFYWTMPEKSECLWVRVRQRQGDTRQMGPGCGELGSWGADTCHLQPVLTPEYLLL